MIAIGSSAVYFIDVENGKQNSFDYDMKTLTGYAKNRKNGVAISLSSDTDSRSSEVFIVDGEGKQSDFIDIDDKVKSLDLDGEHIAVLTSGKISVYDLKGKQIKVVDVEADSKKICFGGGSSLYVLGTSLISKSDFS